MDSEIQRIARLTPLADLLASFDMGVAAVAPHEVALADALGRTLAADVIVDAAHPPVALALRDGYAVRAEATADASAYAPAMLDTALVEAGQPMPADADAVALHDGMAIEDGTARAIAAVGPGEGVLPAAADAAPGARIGLAGAQLRPIDIAVMAALGIERVTVRVPRIRIVRPAEDRVLDAAALLVAHAVAAEGGVAIRDDLTLDAALQRDDADAVIAIGGTGSGRDDAGVRTLARRGCVQVHGIGITPGETAAFGEADRRPALLLPGRVDAALAGWLTVGRRMLARMAFRLIEPQPFTAELARKVASPLGLAEVVPVRRRGHKVEPLGGGYLPLQVLARAEGWILVPADSEGYPPGAMVSVRPWP
jgi:molybdopterin molybdotransferase